MLDARADRGHELLAQCGVGDPCGGHVVGLLSSACRSCRR
jgi:hypothetical protein